MNMSKKVAAGIFLGMTALAGSAWAASNGTSDTIIPKDGKAMRLEQSWDKIFPKSDKVDHRKVIFTNRYGIALAGDLRRERPLRRGEGAGVRPLCPDDGRARLSDARL